MGSVGDVDIVPDPDPENLDRALTTFAAISVRPMSIPPSTALACLDVVSVPTVYGKVDCLLERARIEYHSLLARSDPILVTDVPVAVAGIDDGWRLRHEFGGER